MSHLFYDPLSVFLPLQFLVLFVYRTMSLWMSSITSRATWRRGCRITRLEAPPSPAKMAWRAHAAPVEARSTTALYRMPVPQHTCSLWHTRTHTHKACRSSAPSTSSPSAPGEIRLWCAVIFSESLFPQPASRRYFGIWMWQSCVWFKKSFSSICFQKPMKKRWLWSTFYSFLVKKKKKSKMMFLFVIVAFIICTGTAVQHLSKFPLIRFTVS